jgi:hypothetical protein
MVVARRKSPVQIGGPIQNLLARFNGEGHFDIVRLVRVWPEAVRDGMGNDTVRDLRFVQGRLSRRERPRLRAVPRGVRHAIELPVLKDPELKEAFERLIEAWGRASR